MAARDWVDFVEDAQTGIETLRAHFEGHAYDPPWHDSYLVGTTVEGIQQFRCHGVPHRSTSGRVFMLETDEIRDGCRSAPISAIWAAGSGAPTD